MNCCICCRRFGYGNLGGKVTQHQQQGISASSLDRKRTIQVSIIRERMYMFSNQNSQFRTKRDSLIPNQDVVQSSLI